LAKLSKRNNRSTKSRKAGARQATPSVSRVDAGISVSLADRLSPFTIPPNLIASRPRDSNVISTGGQVFPDGTSLELTREAEAGNNRLLFWADGKSSTGQVVDLYGSRYAPGQGADLIQHLPETPAPYESTAALFDAVAAFIRKYSRLDQDNAALLTFVCLSSFFFDCISMSPCLLLFGPPIPAMSLLRVIRCVCRHGFLSSGSSIRGLPPELRPTRLVCQADTNIDKELAALQFRGVHSSSGAPREINGTTLIYAGDTEFKTPFADVCFPFQVAFDGPPFSLQDEALEIPTITRLQNRLLMYRLQNRSRVKSSRFDVPDFSGITREFARTLGGCIVDAPDLQSRVIELLRPHDEADRTRYAVTLEAIVLEALLVDCHERKPSVHVGDIAAVANKILKERGEFVKLSPKQIGGRLKNIGIRTARLDSGGRGIYLLNEQCARIHKLGRAFGVATLREGLPGCRFCQQ
jgi:hypothetical protein